MSAVPTFLLDQDEDELDDLASVGIDLNRPMSEAEIDDAMSEIMRRMAWYDGQIKQAKEAERLEVERINARYNRRLAPLQTRREEIEALACLLAQRATFGGKKRSRSVGNGTFGVRATPERVEITDKAVALEWAKSHCPEAVEVQLTEKLQHKTVAPLVIAYIKTHDGEQPDGFDVHPAGETYYCRPEID
jgi:hypothetical protein